MPPRTEGVDEANIIAHPRTQKRKVNLDSSSLSSKPSKKAQGKRKTPQADESDSDIQEVSNQDKGLRRSPRKKQRKATAIEVSGSDSEQEDAQPPNINAGTALVASASSEPSISVQDSKTKKSSTGRSKTAAVTLFFRYGDKSDAVRCKVCEGIQENDSSHYVHPYSSNTSNTSLRKHIMKDHPNAATLLQQLEENGVPDHVPDDLARIDTFFTKQAPGKTLSYTKEEFAMRCLRFIAALDLPLSIVEKPEFRDLCIILRPSCVKDIPSRQRMASLALSQLEEIKDTVKRLLSDAKGRISFTVDCWSAGDMDNYLGMTAHFVTDDWLLKEELLAFELSNQSHTGKSLAKTVFTVLQRFGLVKKGKLGWFTTDNAPNNDTMMAELERLFRQAGIPSDDWDRETKHIRCMPHIYNLAVGDVVEALSKKAYSNETEAAIATPTEAELADPLVRLRKFVVTVRLSTLKRCAFAELQQLHYPELGIKKNDRGELRGALVLMLDVVTRWSSTYFMLRRAIRLRKAIDTMMVHADFTELSKYQLSQEDWKRIEFLALILEKANMCQQMLSATSHPTLPLSIPALEHLQSSWEQLQNQCREVGDDATADVLQEGLNKLAKYYKLQEKSEAYGNSLILTPWIKMAYLKRWWKDTIIGEGGLPTTLADQAEEEFIQTYLTHYAPVNQATLPSSEQDLPSAINDLWGDIFNEDESSGVDPRQDALRYLSQHLTKHPDRGGPSSLEWWKVHEGDYAGVAPMARDYLAIQGSATPVERVWSSASDTDTKKRNRLSAEQLEALQFLKSMYRKARVKALTPDQRKALTAARCRLIDDQNWGEDVVQKADLSVEELEDCLDYTM